MEATSIEPVRPVALRMAFAPDHAAAREVSMAIRNFLAEQGVAEKELFSYELCIAEASNNAIEYAEGPSRKLRPVAEVLFTPCQIELRVTDHTPGFVLRDKIPPPEPMVDRGRGLFIIQSVVDEALYLRGTRENILVMRKKRGAASAKPAVRKEASADPLTLEKSQKQLAESVAQMANMADELQLRSETLSSIFRSCAELGSIDKASENFEGRLLIDLLHLTSANWYVLRMLSPDGRKLLVSAASESDLVATAVDLPENGSARTGIEANVAASRTAARFDIRESTDMNEPL